MTGPTTQSPTPPGAVAREHPQSEDEQEDEKALGEKRQLDVHERAVEREQYSGGKAGATIAENPRRQHGDEPADDAAESALQQTRNERRVPPQLQQQREEIRVRWAVAGCEPAEHLAFVDVSRPEEKLPGIELRTLEECSVVELRGEPGADGEGDYGDGGEPRPGQAPRRRRARRRDRSADGLLGATLSRARTPHTVLPLLAPSHAHVSLAASPAAPDRAGSAAAPAPPSSARR